MTYLCLRESISVEMTFYPVRDKLIRCDFCHETHMMPKGRKHTG